ncbi:MAG: hypothetical protein ABGW78_02965, partial [Pirellulales bacterium]
LESGFVNQTLEYNVSQAVEKHQDASGLIMSVAGELPSKQGTAWRKMADVLKKCDVPEAQRLANLNARCWLPLFVSERGDPRLLERVLSVIEKPQQRYSFFWAALAYPVMILGLASAILFLFSLVVLPLFRSLFVDFGLQLPFMTVAMFKVVTFFSGWGVFLAIGFIALGRFLMIKRSLYGPQICEEFARSLSMLRGAGATPHEAIELAASSIGIQKRIAMRPARRGPMTNAIMFALLQEPRVARILIEAIADCQRDRVRRGVSTTQWFLGPIAIGVAGLVVAVVVTSLFMPLIHLVSALS